MRKFASTGVKGLDLVLGGGYPCGAVSLVHPTAFISCGFRELIERALEADGERCVLIDNKPTLTSLHAGLRSAPELLIVNGWVRRPWLAAATRTIEIYLPRLAPRTAVLVLNNRPSKSLLAFALVTIEVKQRDEFPLLTCTIRDEVQPTLVVLCQ